MKRTLILIVLWLSFLTMTAQNILLCTGTVSNSQNGNPISNQVVSIHNDSAAGTSGYFYHTVLTNTAGVYYDSILLQPVNNQGTVHIGTIDCQGYLNVYSATYGTTSYSIQHDFSICYSGTTCNADFYSIQDSNGVNSFTFVPTYTANVTTWLWDFGDGTYATVAFPQSPNVTHTFAGPATNHTVCLTIQSSNSCTDTKCHTVTYTQNTCIANFTYSDSTNIMNPVHFMDLSQGSGGIITSWLWNFGDPASGSTNISTIQNPLHTFTMPGNYLVCLTIQGSDSSCYDMTCKTVSVGGSTGCQAYYTYIIDSIPLAGTPVQFTDHSQGHPTSWAWDFGDGTTSTLQNPSHTYATGGSYTVCLTIQGDSCQDTYCATVHVGAIPGCSSYFTHTATYLSVDFQGFITSVNYLQGGVFTWSFGDGTTGQGQNVTHHYAQTGSYPVNLTATDSSGCSSTYVEIISLYDSINTHQIYGQVFAGNFPLTSGLAMIFSLDSTANYSPYVSTAAIDSAGIYYFTMVPDGNYYIVAIPILPAGYLPTYYGNALDWQNATVVQLGQAANPYNINLLMEYNSIGGNGTINGQVNMGQVKSTFLDKVTMLLMNEQLQPINFFKVNTTGDFTFPTLSFGTYYLKAEIPGVTSDVVMVVITDASPVANVTMTFTGNKILGIDETNPTITAGILYPNPVSDVVNLSLKTNQATTVQVDVFDMKGQAVVHSGKALGTGESVITIPVGNIARGIYTLRIHSDQGINIIRKLVK